LSIPFSLAVPFVFSNFSPFLYYSEQLVVISGAKVGVPEDPEGVVQLRLAPASVGRRIAVRVILGGEALVRRLDHFGLRACANLQHFVVGCLRHSSQYSRREIRIAANSGPIGPPRIDLRLLVESMARPPELVGVTHKAVADGVGDSRIGPRARSTESRHALPAQNWSASC
jgi:hypothetical protein